MENKKKILIITDYFYPYNHPATHRIGSILRYFPKNGWEVLVICPKWTRFNCPMFDSNMVLDFKNSNVIKAVKTENFLYKSFMKKIFYRLKSMSNMRFLFEKIMLRWFHLFVHRNPSEFY